MNRVIGLVFLMMIVSSCLSRSYEYYITKRDKAAAQERFYLDKKKTYISQNPDRDKAAIEEAKAKAKLAYKANRYRQVINECNEKLSLMRIKGLSDEKQPSKKKK
jgi:hypothetical protein